MAVRTLVGASLVRLLADGEGHVTVFDHVLDLAAHYEKALVYHVHDMLQAMAVSENSALADTPLRSSLSCMQPLLLLHIQKNRIITYSSTQTATTNKPPTPARKPVHQTH